MLEQGRSEIGKDQQIGNTTYLPSPPHPCCATDGVSGGFGSEGAKQSLGEGEEKLF